MWRAIWLLATTLTMCVSAAPMTISTQLVRRAASTVQVESNGTARWQLDTEGYFECTATRATTPQCAHLRFSAFQLHRHELDGVKLERVRVLLETRAAAPDVVAVDLVRLVANSRTADILTATRASVLTLNSTLSTVEFAFNATDIDAQLMQGVGTADFEEDFTVELGFATFGGMAPVEVHVHGVTLQLDFTYEIEVQSVSPLMFNNRTGGEPVNIALSGLRSFGGYKCRFGEQLAVTGTLLSAGDMLTTADTVQMMATTASNNFTATTPSATTAAMVSSTVAATTTATITTTTPATDTTTTTTTTTSSSSDDNDSNPSFTPTDGIVQCHTPRVPSSGAYDLSISLDGGRTFFPLPAPTNTVTVGRVREVPEKADWEKNTVVIRASANSTQFEVETNFDGEEVDEESDDDKPLIKLEPGTTYTFIAATDCTHPVYLSTGKGGILRNRPTAVMDDRLDNTNEREVCEGGSFEFTPTKSYPEVFYYQSTREVNFGHKIMLDKSDVEAATPASTPVIQTLAILMAAAALLL